MDQTHLMTATSHVGGDHGVKAEREHVVLVCGEGEPVITEVGGEKGLGGIATHLPDLSTFSLLRRW